MCICDKMQHFLYNPYFLVSIRTLFAISMRKRDIQSFTLKLNDIKEYEAMRMERAMVRAMDTAAVHQRMATDETPVSGPKVPPPLVKFGPKSKQEIRERLGFPET